MTRRTPQGRRRRNIGSDGCPYLDLPEEVHHTIIDQLDVQSKKSLRTTCKCIHVLVNATISRVVLDQAIHNELTGPSRRASPCLHLQHTFPHITRCAIHQQFRAPLCKILSQLPSLNHVSFFDSPPSPNNIKVLSLCPKISSIELYPAHSAWISPFSTLVSLTSLTATFPGQFVSLRPLSLLTRIKQLTLWFSSELMHLEPSTFQPLSELRLLRDLNLILSFQVQGAASLSHLQQLTSLQLLSNCAFTLTSVLALTSLRSLQVGRSSAASTFLVWQKPCAPTFPYLTTLQLPLPLLAAPSCPIATQLSSLHVLVERTDNPTSLAFALHNLSFPAIHSLHIQVSMAKPDFCETLMQSFAGALPHLRNLQLGISPAYALISKLDILSSLTELTSLTIVAEDDQRAKLVEEAIKACRRMHLPRLMIEAAIARFRAECAQLAMDALPSAEAVAALKQEAGGLWGKLKNLECLNIMAVSVEGAS